MEVQIQNLVPAALRKALMRKTDDAPTPEEIASYLKHEGRPDLANQVWELRKATLPDKLKYWKSVENEATRLGRVRPNRWGLAHAEMLRCSRRPNVDNSVENSPYAVGKKRARGVALTQGAEDERAESKKRSLAKKLLWQQACEKEASKRGEKQGEG